MCRLTAVRRAQSVTGSKHREDPMSWFEFHQEMSGFMRHMKVAAVPQPPPPPPKTPTHLACSRPRTGRRGGMVWPSLTWRTQEKRGPLLDKNSNPILQVHKDFHKMFKKEV
jgi:hypothetical protein